jgi:hypothetical protein
MTEPTPGRIRKNLPILTIVFCQALLAGLAALLYHVARPDFAKAYEEYAGPIPAHARLALSSWFLPSLVVIAVVLDIVALAMRRRSMRNLFLGLGLVIPAIGLALAVDGIFVPMFQAAPAP